MARKRLTRRTRAVVATLAADARRRQIDAWVAGLVRMACARESYETRTGRDWRTAPVDPAVDPRWLAAVDTPQN